MHQVKGCTYSFAGGAGSFGVLTNTYSSSRQAGICGQEGLTQDSHIYGRGFEIIKIPALGSQAVSLILPNTGTQAGITRNAKSLSVAIFWPPAARRPQIAVTLLREAIVKFDRYSSPLTFGCA
jgi:hypothetical protein